MSFSGLTVYKIWQRAGGKCEERDEQRKRCRKQLVWEERNLSGDAAWSVFQIDKNKLELFSNGLLLCKDCYHQRAKKQEMSSVS